MHLDVCRRRRSGPLAGSDVGMGAFSTKFRRWLNFFESFVWGPNLFFTVLSNLRHFGVLVPISKEALHV